MGMGILNSVMYYLISITSMYDAPYRLIPSLSGGVDLCHYFCVIFMENFFLLLILILMSRLNDFSSFEAEVSRVTVPLASVAGSLVFGFVWTLHSN